MQVFISHVAADEKLAREIAAALKSAGFDVWSLDSIFPGDNWAKILGEALESSELMVVLCTQNAAGSPYLTREVQFALTSGNYRGRVVAVFVDSPRFQTGADVPWVLRDMNPVQYSSSTRDFREIVNRVAAVAREGANAA
jgi:TIR domain